MTPTKRWAALAITIAALVKTAGAVEVIKSDRTDLDIDGRIQMFAPAQLVSDPARNDLRLYMYLKQARLGFKGDHDGMKFQSEFAFAAEEILNSNVTLTALDLNMDLKLHWLGDDVWAKVGQFKVPFGRETLHEDGHVAFADRSIVNQAFQWNRDMGVALYSMPGKLSWTLGVYDGGGRDVPERYLGELLGTPLIVAKIGYNDGADEDLFTAYPVVRKLDRTRKAFYISGLFVHDTLIGHSTVLNLKQTDRSLLISKNWNPYIGRMSNLGVDDFDKADLWQVSAEAVLRKPFGDGMAFNGELQGDYGQFSNIFGSVGAYGARAQGVVTKGEVDAGVRLAAVWPEQQFFAAPATAVAQPTTPITGEPYYEITPMLTWNFNHTKAHDMKLVADMPLLFNVPVFNELFTSGKRTGVGSYVSIDQPDQSTVLNTSGNFVNLQNVVEARLMLQVAF